MDDLTLDEALEELESAEDFLNYFGVQFDAAVVHVNRLHILQRYHNYLAKAGSLPEAEEAKREVYTTLLTRAYQDFVTSDALTEKVFHMHEPQTAFVPLTSITFATPAAAPATGGCGCGNTGSCHSSEAALRG